MTFSDGASTFYPLVSMVVSSYEDSPGYTEQNSGLNYTGQSVRITEASSDMAGKADEYYSKGASNDLQAGAQTFKGSGARAYKANPPPDRKKGRRDGNT